MPDTDHPPLGVVLLSLALACAAGAMVWIGACGLGEW